MVSIKLMFERKPLESITTRDQRLTFILLFNFSSNSILVNAGLGRKKGSLRMLELNDNFRPRTTAWGDYFVITSFNTNKFVRVIWFVMVHFLTVSSKMHSNESSKSGGFNIF